MALVTLARARYHPEAAQVGDTLLQAALDVAEEKVITLLGNDVLLAEHTDTLNVTDPDRVWLSQLPVVSLTTATLTDRVTLETTTIDVADLDFDPNTGEVRYAKSATVEYEYFPLGWQNLQMVYQAGDAIVTEDIQEAVCQLALALIEVCGTANLNRLGSEDGDYENSLRAAANSGIPLLMLQLLHDKLVPGVHNE